MNFIPIQYFTNYINAHILLGRFEEEGILCWLKDENTVTINPIFMHAIGGIKLMVAEDHLEKARALLLELHKDQMVYNQCPKCGSGNVQLVSTPRKLVNWVSSILGYLFGSYAIAVDKVNHCFDCGHEFEPLAMAE